MLERAMLIGARVEFETGPEGGTELCLDVPVRTKT
jgi:signal transduction histidine kinase